MCLYIQGAPRPLRSLEQHLACERSSLITCDLEVNLAHPGRHCINVVELDLFFLTWEFCLNIQSKLHNTAILGGAGVWRGEKKHMTVLEVGWLAKFCTYWQLFSWKVNPAQGYKPSSALSLNTNGFKTTMLNISMMKMFFTILPLMHFLNVHHLDNDLISRTLHVCFCEAEAKFPDMLNGWSKVI